MLHDYANWRITVRRVALALSAIAFVAAPAANAQNMMRTPNLNIGPRTPNITPNIPGPNVVSHIDANIAARTGAVGDAARPRLYLRTSPNLYPDCSGPRRDPNGECVNLTSDGDGSKGKGKAWGGPRRNGGPAINVMSTTNDIVAEIEAMTNEQADALARSHGLRRLESQNFPLIGATIGLFRISDGRSFEAASRDFSADSNVHSVQRNFRYFLQDQKTVPAEGDPAQYALAKLRLPEAHRLAHGLGIRLAVIDSGIDAKHRELTGAIVDSFDALASSEGP